MEERIRDLERRYEDLSSLLADPATLADSGKLREISIRVELENLVVDESNHRDNIRRMLEGWK